MHTLTKTFRILRTPLLALALTAATGTAGAHGLVLGGHDDGLYWGIYGYFDEPGYYRHHHSYRYRDGHHRHGHSRHSYRKDHYRDRHPGRGHRGRGHHRGHGKWRD